MSWGLVFFQTRYTADQEAHEKMLNITNHQGSANQNHNKVSPHAHQIDCYQKDKKKITRVVEDMEKREPSYAVVGNVNCCSHYGEQYGASSKVPYNPAS